MGSFVNWPLAELMQQAIAAHAAGVAQGQRRQQLDQENQDRALARQHLKLQMDALKLDEAFKEKQHQMMEAQFLQSLPTQQFGVQNQMQVPGPETSLRSQGDGGPPPQWSSESIGQGTVTPPHVVGGPMGDLAVPGLQQVLQQGMQQSYLKSLAESRAKTEGSMIPGQPYGVNARIPESAVGSIITAGMPAKAEAPITLSRDMPGIAKAGEQINPKELGARVEIYKEQLKQADKAREEAAQVGNLDDAIQTTANGNKYLNLSQFQGTAKNLARVQAQKNGVAVLDKDQANALQEVENARMNLDMIDNLLAGKLPRDASGRIVGGLENRIKALTQSDNVLASAGTLRTAAIQMMRAAAGSKGLRINRAEIEMSANNDIPQITDTVGVALQRTNNMRRLLDNVESSIVGKKAAAGGTPTAPAMGPTATDPKTGKKVQFNGTAWVPVQ